MQITGVRLESFMWIAGQVSQENYDWNLSVAPGARDTGTVTASRCTARLCTLTSYGPGSRRAASGTRGTYACWHAYRDVLALLFERYPNATVRTRMATYRGKEGFLANYPETAVADMGSPGRSAYMPDLCACSHTDMPPQFARLIRPPGTYAPYLAGLQPAESREWERELLPADRAPITF